jgi:hypothetical protein
MDARTTIYFQLVALQAGTGWSLQFLYKSLCTRKSSGTSMTLRPCGSHGIMFMQMRGSRHRSLWRKGLTAFFLLWTLADLSVPGLCRTDNDRSQDLQAPLSTTSNTLAIHRQSMVTRASVPAPERQGSPSLDEDCFCCCSHIVPAPHFQIPAISESVPTLAVYHFNSVTASALPLYHPPRS